MSIFASRTQSPAVAGLASPHGSSNPSSIRQPSVSYAPSDNVVENGEAWASSASKDPWDPVILALDGGGIRGYSSLLILKAIMHQVAIYEKKLADSEGQIAGESTLEEEDLLPCHYFDFMYGTSTGGLIATMLGRLRMSVPQCLEIYRDVGDNLFGKKRSKIPLTTKYDHKPLERAVRDIVRTHCKQHGPECNGEDYFPWDVDIQDKAGVDYDRHICQTVCLTAVHNGKIDSAHLLRTYNQQYIAIPNWVLPYNDGYDPLKVWQVTRATSAAPFYFDALEVDINGELYIFKDGGIRENNPSGAAWTEFVSLNGPEKDPAVLLSIGTGRPDESQDGFATAWPGPFGKSRLLKKWSEKVAVVRNVLIKYTDGELKHRDMVQTAKGEHHWYKRLNVSSGLEDLPLDDWRKGPWRNPKTGVVQNIPGGLTLSKMEEVTASYLERDIERPPDTYGPPRTMVEQTAEKLVRQRRARARAAMTGDEEVKKRWETFTGHYINGVYSPEPDGPVMHQLKPAVASA